MKEWLGQLLKKYNRNSVFVHFHPHAEMRSISRSADIDKIVETVRRGKVLERRSTMPDRIAFSNYFKEGSTYLVIAKGFPNSLQVITVWKKKGKT